MPKDKYKNFQDLSRTEVRDEDYRIRVVERNSSVAVIAPHGGQIEPGTSEVATVIALDSFNLYCFEGLRPVRLHCELHITSTKFDEPTCVELVEDCDFIVAVHGRADELDTGTIWLGGIDTNLRDRIAAKLRIGGFLVQTDAPKHRAENPKNICNRGRRKMGVQLEIPRSLRRSLLEDQAVLDRFSNAVKQAIHTVCS